MKQFVEMYMNDAAVFLAVNAVLVGLYLTYLGFKSIKNEGIKIDD